MTIASSSVDVQLAVTAAAAGARVLPSSRPLVTGALRPGDGSVVAPFAGAVLADLEGSATGRVGVLVGDDGPGVRLRHRGVAGSGGARGQWLGRGEHLAAGAGRVDRELGVDRGRDEGHGVSFGVPTMRAASR